MNSVTFDTPAQGPEPTVSQLQHPKVMWQSKRLAEAQCGFHFDPDYKREFPYCSVRVTRGARKGQLCNTKLMVGRDWCYNHCQQEVKDLQWKKELVTKRTFTPLERQGPPLTRADAPVSYLAPRFPAALVVEQAPAPLFTSNTTPTIIPREELKVDKNKLLEELLKSHGLTLSDLLKAAVARKLEQQQVDTSVFGTNMPGPAASGCTKLCDCLDECVDSCECSCHD